MMNTTNNALIFDLDGTLNRFYEVENWLDDLQNERVRPYLVCDTKVDIDTLNMICDLYRMLGYKIIITTWLAKNATTNYDNMVRKAKLEWLKKVGFNYDEIHMVKYGTTKADCTRKYKGIQILVDDNEKIRKGFENATKNRYTINANENILDKLLEMLDREL